MTYMNNKNYFKIDALTNLHIQHGFFSRLGGYSKKKYRSLNCSLSSEDLKERVIKNIELTKEILNLNFTKMKFINQIQSTNVELIKNQREKNKYL